MKKRDKKLQLNRETVLQLDNDNLKQALGGIESSCFGTECCGPNQTFQVQQIN